MKRYTANASFREHARSHGSVFRAADAAHDIFICTARFVFILCVSGVAFKFRLDMLVRELVTMMQFQLR